MAVALLKGLRELVSVVVLTALWPLPKPPLPSQALKLRALLMLRVLLVPLGSRSSSRVLASARSSSAVVSLRVAALAQFVPLLVLV